MPQISPRQLDRQFRPLLGLPCWGLHHAPQLNLSLNFGSPNLSIREPIVVSKDRSETVRRLLARRNVTVRGRWWLWLRLCYWRLEANGELLATGSSSNRRIELALLELSGQKLLAVAVNGVTGRTRFDFDLGCRLECRRFAKDSEDELWVLYKRDGDVLSAYANGVVQQERGAISGGS